MKGPGPLSVDAKPAAPTAVTRVLNVSSADAISTTSGNTTIGNAPNSPLTVTY